MNTATRIKQSQIDALREIQSGLLERLGDRSGIQIERLADSLDSAVALRDRTFALSQHDRSREFFRLVQRALAKLEAGTYGTCEECGEVIPEVRLVQIPWAQYCKECQMKEENGELKETYANRR